MNTRPPLPPFSRDDAVAKVRAAENAWNTREPEHVATAYTLDTRWRNRATFLRGRDAVVAFLSHKWSTEHDYRLIKSLWAFDDDRIAVRFAYEWRDAQNQWYLACGNEMWQFADDGLMARREASINDVAIHPEERLFHWPLGPRPDDHPGLEALDL